MTASENLILEPLRIPGLHRLQTKPFMDERGSFGRVFCAEVLRMVGWEWPVSQINLSRTTSRGTVRGVHFQRPPFTDAKIVYCMRGEVFDVAVDLRAGSPTFLQWHGELLSAEEGTALIIPKGCAHGFQTMTDDCELLYVHSEPFRSDHDAGFSPTDPRLAIKWPLPISVLSARDFSQPHIEPTFDGLTP
ncbi:MAG: dTDP-4-dehydrorhamnose 3,5-epimerase family protein [Actinomycetota bacterium]|nr:dTDP-4-dehydrorhamnose 3,5-epimerase family protein [Actinomycetota bacterium]